MPVYQERSSKQAHPVGPETNAKRQDAQFKDNRPVSAIQRKIQALVDNSVKNQSPRAITNQSSKGVGPYTPIHDQEVLQGVFTLKRKDYYEGDVKSGTPAHKALVNHPGYFEAAAALAKSDVEVTFQTEREMIDYLEEHHSDIIQQAVGMQDAEDEEYEDLLLFLGGEQMKPRGWGHTFSNGRHGQDMALNNGALAIERAVREDKPAIGVWINNDKSEKLIETSFGRVRGEDASYFEDLFGMPESVGVAYQKDGKKVACDGFFIKIQDQIVISAYPARKKDIPQDSLTRYN